jgi:hypothetical protein
MATTEGESGLTFMECTSLQLHYDIMGLVTVSFTVVSDSEGIPDLEEWTSISAGGKTFSGHITNVHMQSIPNTGWFETHITLIATTN